MTAQKLRFNAIFAITMSKDFFHTKADIKTYRASFEMWKASGLM